ncbi:Uncharacterised protein [Mycobacteroides abscessus subsp. abscessus]|nr:Uncharacterised protein [Mycobacteroides abscessus subsp. abscessus]
MPRLLKSDSSTSSSEESRMVWMTCRAADRSRITSRAIPAINRVQPTALRPRTSSAYADSSSLATSWVSTVLSPSKVVNTSISRRRMVSWLASRYPAPPHASRHTVIACWACQLVIAFKPAAALSSWRCRSASTSSAVCTWWSSSVSSFCAKASAYERAIRGSSLRWCTR